MNASFVLSLLLALCVGIAQADDKTSPRPSPSNDRERAAKAALALAAASSPEKCECSKSRVLSWKDAVAKADRENLPIVVFSNGAEPRCCAGAIPAKIDDLPAGFKPDKPIVVYRRNTDGKTWDVVAELPADAPRETIKAAVAKATSKKP